MVTITIRCDALRQGDEMYCWKCDMRWPADEPTPERCDVERKRKAAERQTDAGTNGK